MQKKYIVAIIVVVVLAVGLLFLNDKKKKTEYQDFAVKTGGRLVAMANKSSRAGLAKMGRALNEYKETMGVYPDTLMDLYPRFINMKEFITEVNWTYEKQSDNFILTKTLLKGETQQMASIDKSLRPHTGETVLAASIEQSVTQSISSRTNPATQTVILAREVLKPKYVSDEERKRVLDGQTEPIIERPEVVASRQGEIRKGMGADLGQKFMVWKDDQGHLGFGNLAYPDRARLSAYAAGSWLDISYPASVKKQGHIEELRMASIKGNKEDLAAAQHSKNMLVWKDAAGHLGFGNQVLPNKSATRVFDGGQWAEMEKPLAVAEASSSMLNRMSARKSPDEIASGLSKAMTVWKDAGGHLGFGNNMIPDDAGTARVFQNEEWIASERSTSTTAENTNRTTSFQPARLSAAEIAERQSMQFVVWKDSRGRLGFGNVLHPNREQVQVRVGSEWENVEKAPRAAGMTAAVSTPSEKPDFEKKAKGLCEEMLVWKNRSGVIGFGNLDYPVESEAEYICVNGAWEKAAN